MKRKVADAAWLTKVWEEGCYAIADTKIDFPAKVKEFTTAALGKYKIEELGIGWDCSQRDTGLKNGDGEPIKVREIKCKSDCCAAGIPFNDENRKGVEELN